MEKVILSVPFFLGIILIFTGLGMILARTKGAVITEGTVTDIARMPKRYGGVKTVFEAPVVKYSVNGVEYTAVSEKFFPAGAMDFKKKQKISIRVKRRNHRSFVPEESGRTLEKLITGAGIFMIISHIVILCRY